MDKKPYIIVGFGIAGVTVAWQLYMRKLTFIIVANPVNTCSRAAAGLINPIVFKRLNMSWLATDLLPIADGFYQNVEEILGKAIRRHSPIIKIFNSIEDENNWMIKKNSSPYKSYFGEVTKPDIIDVEIPYGTGTVNTIGHLDTNSYIDLSKEFFRGAGVKLIEEDFEYSKINGDKYQLQRFEKIIFCEGFGIKKNPFFNYLPVPGTHGDTLIIKTKNYDFKGVLNKNLYIMPMGDNLYKLGASINWDKKEAEITEEGKAELISRLRTFAHFSFEIVEQQAGIRPTVKDRRPLVGLHPINKQMAIFNGLGTKGVMLAPYFSNQLIKHICENSPLNAEVDIVRFEKFLP